MILYEKSYRFDTARRAKELDRQIADLADTICKVGKSDILTKKLRKLEGERLELSSHNDDIQRASRVVPIGGDAAWREVVENLESLHKYARPDEVAEAREALQGILGSDDRRGGRPDCGVPRPRPDS